MEDEDDAPGAEFEVESIVRYRQTTDGQELFLVKWVGYPVTEATWEPLEHLNENCTELIAKARAVFAWRKGLQAAPTPQATTPAVGEADADAAPPALEEAALEARPAEESAPDKSNAPAEGLPGHDRG